MRVDVIEDLAAVIREGRGRLGWSQDDLARRAGVSRRWLAGLEAGKDTVQWGMVQRVLRALGLVTSIVAGPARTEVHDVLDDLGGTA